MPLHRLLAYLAASSTVDGPANRTGLGDDSAFRPGTWLRKQDKARTDGKLTDRQTALLDALHRHVEIVAG
ncbi:helicase associated domain-containing protein [Kitasatospora sp. NPDC058190]|uniref:helicase associated domain-containing protein n=1 Tax=Kitasatospora sp. NPDC058190 TaxID=3346371 RepID=UPI0036D8260D